MWVQGRAEVRTDARCGRPRARPVPGKRALRHPRRPRAPPPARAPSRPPPPRRGAQPGTPQERDPRTRALTFRV